MRPDRSLLIIFLIMAKMRNTLSLSLSLSILILIFTALFVSAIGLAEISCRAALSVDLANVLIKKMTQLAERTDRRMSYRIKDIDSIMQKVIDRTESYSKSGRIYHVSDLSDTIGFRLVLNRGSKYLNLSSKREWADLLGLNSDQIIEVEAKGTAQDIQFGTLGTTVMFIKTLQAIL